MNGVYDETSSCEFSASHHKVRVYAKCNSDLFGSLITYITSLSFDSLTLQPSHVNAPKWNPAAGSSHTLHCWFICNYRNYRSYSKEIRQSQLLRLILGRIKCGVLLDGGAANRFSTFASIFIPPTISYGCSNRIWSTREVIGNMLELRLSEYANMIITRKNYPESHPSISIVFFCW